ncbi:hypothetical protein [Rhodovulum marinum]|uniref:HdeA/HdeB family protein n=1 Tax=Rhodovulum marinum TaxID=320662 RepID=A0A4V2SRC4_9RHOB|nr:hypothetical protein [Rhodovulum marinum]TCP42146.1 hypothetical protein EV662_10351 [Rhodovulum marinum]
MFRAVVFACLAGLSAEPALAGQRATSESLVDCAALLTIPARAYPDRAAAQPGGGLSAVAEAFLDGAEGCAAAEGHAAPDAHIAALFQRKAALWDGRGMGFTVTEDFRDWMVYCRDLAGRLDIPLGR